MFIRGFGLVDSVVDVELGVWITLSGVVAARAPLLGGCVALRHPLVTSRGHHFPCGRVTEKWSLPSVA